MMVIQSITGLFHSAETGVSESFHGQRRGTTSIELSGEGQRAVSSGASLTNLSAVAIPEGSTTQTTLENVNVDREGVVSWTGASRPAVANVTVDSIAAGGSATTQGVDLLALNTPGLGTFTKREAARVALRGFRNPFNIGSIFIQTPGGTNSRRNLLNTEFNLVPTGDFENAGMRIEFTPELPANAFPITVNVALDAYTTAGTPDFLGEVRVTYDVPAYTEQRTDIFPADRCRWQQEASSNGRGYHIYDAEFYPGNANPVTIVDPQLGFIGKTGRFVAITDKT